MELNQNPLLLLNQKIEELEHQKAQEAKRQKELAQQKAERRSAFNSAFRKAEQKNKWVAIGYTDKVAQKLSKEEFLEQKAQELFNLKQHLESAVVKELNRIAKIKRLRPAISAEEARNQAQKAREQEPKLTRSGKPFPKKAQYVKKPRPTKKSQKKALKNYRTRVKNNTQKQERPVSKEQSLERALNMDLFSTEKERRKAQQQLNELKKARKSNNKQQRQQDETTSYSKEETNKHSSSKRQAQARIAKTKLEALALNAFCFFIFEEKKNKHYAQLISYAIKKKERTHRSKSQRKLDAKGQTKSQRKRPAKKKTAQK